MEQDIVKAEFLAFDVAGEVVQHMPSILERIRGDFDVRFAFDFRLIFNTGLCLGFDSHRVDVSLCF